jgi:hypothetical protein
MYLAWLWHPVACGVLCQKDHTADNSFQRCIDRACGANILFTFCNVQTAADMLARSSPQQWQVFWQIETVAEICWRPGQDSNLLPQV